MHLLDEAHALAVTGVDVGLPAHRLVGHVHGREHRLVEAVLAHEGFRDVGQEHPRLRALDDAVVVGGGERDHGADADLGQAAAVGGLELGRVAERTHPDDRSLARHQPGHRLHGAERAGIGERHRGAGEVVGGGLAGVDLAHELLVGDHEGPEVEGLGRLDHRHQEGAGAVGLLEVDGQAQADLVVMDHPVLPGSVGVGDEAGVERGHGLEGPDDGEADEMGEAHLATRGPGQMLVENGPVDLEELGRDGAHAGGGGDRQRRLHVLDDARRRPPQR